MGRPYATTLETRQKMWALWLKGFTFIDIARQFKTYRQKTRSIVLAFDPTFEQFRQHDENRRIRQMAGKLSPNLNPWGMSNTTQEKWTPQEEEIIGFFMDLIPVLQEVKADLEQKGLLNKKVCVSGGESAPQLINS